MISGRPPAIAIAFIVVAILIWLTGCAPDYPQLSAYEIEQAIAACQKQSGFVSIVSTREVRCHEKEETPK